MHFFDDVAKGVSTFFKAVPFTFKHFGLFLLIPFFLFLLLFLITYFLGDTIYGYVSTYVFSAIGMSSATSVLGKIASLVLKGLLFLLFKIIFFLLFYFFSGYIILMVMSPLLSYLSEKTEKIIKQHEYPFIWSVWFKQVKRSLFISLRNLCIQLAWTLLMLILGIIPFLGWIISPVAAIFIFLINAYFFGFSFMDYSLERKNYSVSQSVKIIQKNKGTSIALGSIFFVSYMIPYLGYFLAPFISIFVTVAATMSMEEVITNH